MTLSIVIPVYNTKAYLSDCLGSILTQSFTDFEILLIDDGSTDGSGELCDEFARLDSRIRFFHKENGGVSSARNLGLANACGEWVYFVDSDDFLLPGGLQTLIECVSDEVDIVMGGYMEVDVSGDVYTVNERAVRVLSKKQSIVTLFAGYGSFYRYCGYMCIRLLRRSVIIKNNLVFDPSISIKEDTLFLMQYICKSNGITRQTTVPVYKYCRRSDSAMGEVESRFHPKYVDSFYALVKMKHEVDALYPSFSQPVFVAKQAIVSRFYSIVGKMESSHVRDEALIEELRSTMYQEVGSMTLFKVQRKLFKSVKLI